jgi:deuterolysin
MRFLQTLASVAYLAVGVQSHSPYKYARQSDNLIISLAPVPGKPTEVKAKITNNGAVDLSLLKIGTFLDERPVEKVKLMNENGTWYGERQKHITDLSQEMLFPLWELS